MPLATLQVVVDAPRHSGLSETLSYGWDDARGPRPLPGQLVRVPLGARTVPGIVWDGEGCEGAPGQPGLRPIEEVLAVLPPLPSDWRELVAFAARYYQRRLGELALAVLPPALRTLDSVTLARRHARAGKLLKALGTAGASEGAAERARQAPPLAPAQQQALDAIVAGLGTDAPGLPRLLHGVTGSGKTEVYLRAAQAALDAGGQALVLVPEINLTPALQAQFALRFAGRQVIALHSGLTPAQRLAGWMAALEGRVDIVLGTRLAIFTPLPRLKLIVVDEEHDPSYKQQEGARYSARDLAVYRGRLQQAVCVLGSATPSLETWAHAQHGRYATLPLPGRIGGGELPQVRCIDMGRLPRDRGKQAPVLAPQALAAMRDRLARGEQTLVFLNRRGYAPVLHCPDCAWKSECPHCSAWRVFHKGERQLRCHHCGSSAPVPRACPTCGNLDIAPIGRGTERLEEELARLLPEARIGRLDADVARAPGRMAAQLAAVHGGDVDILIGTQMVTKGHDFRRITLVVAVNPDGALFSSDFRAPERLFAVLMQAAGRAGRDAGVAGRSELLIQTWNPEHPLYAALARHDFARFAASQLGEREAAGLPPSSHLALLRAEARDPAHAEAFLEAAAEAAADLPEVADGRVVVYPPVPPTLARVAGFERRQMLIEAAQRPALQRMLTAWMPRLEAVRSAQRGVQRWAVDVDPQAI